MSLTEYKRLRDAAEAATDLGEQSALNDQADAAAVAVCEALRRAPASVHVVEVLGRMDGTYVFAGPTEAARFAAVFDDGQVWTGELPVLTTADAVIAAETQE